MMVWSGAGHCVTERLFTTLEFSNCEKIFKYLIGRMMYRIYHGKLRILHCLFYKNSDIYVHNTHHKYSYHMPLCSLCGLRYAGASVWNTILSVNINSNVSLFSLEVLKHQYVKTYFNLSDVPHDIVLLMYNYRLCHFLSIFLLRPLHLCWNILARSGTDKKPINPTGFSAPFAIMIIFCCICTGIYSLC